MSRVAELFFIELELCLAAIAYASPRDTHEALNARKRLRTAALSYAQFATFIDDLPGEPAEPEEP